MPSRYLETQTKKNENQKTVYRYVLYPPIPRTLNDVYILTTPGDRLDLLAQKYYGDVNNWWIIAEANGIGKGTMAIQEGSQLRIPTDIATILEDYRNLNS